MSPTHPLVGSWRVTVTVPGAPATGTGTNLATCGADGTVVVAFPSPVPAPPGQNHRLEFYTPALGTWLATGERSATQTFLSLAADENGTSVGTHTVTAEVDVDPTGASWSGPFRIDATSPTGDPQATITGTVTATRITAPPRRTGA